MCLPPQCSFTHTHDRQTTDIPEILPHIPPPVHPEPYSWQSRSCPALCCRATSSCVAPRSCRLVTSCGRCRRLWGASGPKHVSLHYSDAVVLEGIGEVLSRQHLQGGVREAGGEE